MNKVKLFFTIFPILVFSYFLFCFSSCSMKAEQKSLTNQFEIIDALIMQSQFKDAIKDLKKIEKHSFGNSSDSGLKGTGIAIFS